MIILNLKQGKDPQGVHILKALTVKYDFEYSEDKLIGLAKKVKVIVDDKAKYTDWSQREDIKAELKVDLIIQLAESVIHLLIATRFIKRFSSRPRILRRIDVLGLVIDKEYCFEIYVKSFLGRH